LSKNPIIPVLAIRDLLVGAFETKTVLDDGGISEVEGNG
jgi:hypothetical protein